MNMSLINMLIYGLTDLRRPAGVLGVPATFLVTLGLNTTSILGEIFKDMRFAAARVNRRVGGVMAGDFGVRTTSAFSALNGVTTTRPAGDFRIDTGVRIAATLAGDASSPTSAGRFIGEVFAGVAFCSAPATGVLRQIGNVTRKFYIKIGRYCIPFGVSLLSVLGICLAGVFLGVLAGVVASCALLDSSFVASDTSASQRAKN